MLPSPTELIILKLLRRGEPMYGQEIMTVTELAQGTVYPTLHRMAKDKGFLTVAREEKTGRPGIARRFYKIAAPGLRALAAAEAAETVLARPLPPEPEPAGAH